jgi:hypothetical protein
MTGPSQKLVRIGKTKYKFPKQKVILNAIYNEIYSNTIFAQATYEEAKKICEKDSMAMLSFDSKKELNQITEYIGYIGENIILFPLTLEHSNTFNS